MTISMTKLKIKSERANLTDTTSRVKGRRKHELGSACSNTKIEKLNQSLWIFSDRQGQRNPLLRELNAAFISQKKTAGFRKLPIF